MTVAEAASMKKVWHYQSVDDVLRIALIRTQYRNIFFFLSTLYEIAPSFDKVPIRLTLYY